MSYLAGRCCFQGYFQAQHAAPRFAGRPYCSCFFKTSWTCTAFLYSMHGMEYHEISLLHLGARFTMINIFAAASDSGLHEYILLISTILLLRLLRRLAIYCPICYALFYVLHGCMRAYRSDYNIEILSIQYLLPADCVFH